jgi:hypothetical protein
MQDPSPLRIEDFRTLGDLDLDDFPIVENFTIELFDDSSAGGLGIRFLDSMMDEVIAFPWWAPVEEDLRQWSISDVPLGSLGEPFHDVEQGWQILIWRIDDWVFVMQGDEEGNYRWRIKVEAGRYLSEWARVIEFVRAL